MMLELAGPRLPQHRLRLADALRAAGREGDSARRARGASGFRSSTTPTPTTRSRSCACSTGSWTSTCRTSSTPTRAMGWLYSKVPDYAERVARGAPRDVPAEGLARSSTARTVCSQSGLLVRVLVLPNNVAGRRRVARLDRRDALAARRDLAHGPVLPDPPRGVGREVRGALPLDHGRGVGGGARGPRVQRHGRAASSRSSRPPTATTGRTSRTGRRRSGTSGTSRPGRTACRSPMRAMIRPSNDGLLDLSCFPSRFARLSRPRAPTLPAFHVDSRRLQGTLEKLSEFGRNPEGGVTRIGFSETDMAAREYVIGLMKHAGLAVRVDPAGNIFGRREGSKKLPVLLSGSHIDSVLHGGNFDGDVGSMGAIEVIRALNDGKVKTRHPIEVVVWTNEEGNHFGLGTLGSGVAAGCPRARDPGPQGRPGADDRGLAAPVRPGPVAPDRRAHPARRRRRLRRVAHRAGAEPRRDEDSDRRRRGDRRRPALEVRCHGLRQPRRDDADESPEGRPRGGIDGTSSRCATSCAPETGPPGRHGGLPEGRARSDQRHPRPRGVPGRAARPRRREDRPHVGEDPGRVSRDRPGGRDRDELHASRRRAGRPRGSHPAGGDPGRGPIGRPRHRGPPEPRGPGLAEHRPHRADGDDLRPEQGRDQPLAEGIHVRRRTWPTARRSSTGRSSCSTSGSTAAADRPSVVQRRRRCGGSGSTVHSCASGKKRYS